MPIHLRAEPGDYAPAVLCPGDPRRATYIAETFFDPGARCVNEERGMLGYTGTFEGRPLSVQTTGMGCPSAAIVVEELVQLGATRLVRVGTCGGLQPTMHMADLVVAVAATPEDRTVFTYTNGEPHAPTASWALVERAVALAREQGARAPRRPDRLQRRVLRPRPDRLPAAGASGATWASRWRPPCSTRSPPSARSRP